jgi:dephospho-CoA kinase
MKVIGVTGGIGSGKTTLCRMFQSWGGKVIDADQLAREVVEGNESILKKLEREFGSRTLNPDGSLNRKELGRLAFKSPKDRIKLNRIVHPTLLKLLKEKIRSAKEPGPLIVDAALLVEWNLYRILDYLILVRAAKEVKAKRIAGKWSREEIEERMAAQLPEEEIAERADLVINNDGSLKELEAEARRAWKVIKQIP